MGRIGAVSDSSVLIGNKIPYLEISYPKPYILNNNSKHATRLTYTDVIHNGLNYYGEINEITCNENSPITLTEIERTNLITALKGGVIYNGN